MRDIFNPLCLMCSSCVYYSVCYYIFVLIKQVKCEIKSFLLCFIYTKQNHNFSSQINVWLISFDTSCSTKHFNTWKSRQIYLIFVNEANIKWDKFTLSKPACINSTLAPDQSSKLDLCCKILSWHKVKH